MMASISCIPCRYPTSECNLENTKRTCPVAKVRTARHVNSQAYIRHHVLHGLCAKVVVVRKAESKVSA